MIFVGIGTDKHRLILGKKLILGGVMIEAAKGADGHSDADALVHAVIDALLGAAGLGDIGQYFPDSDAKWKNANSIELLAKTLSILKDAGYTPVNVDATIHLETPKLARLKREMSDNIADTLKISRQRVNVKAKTGERLDAVGKGEAVEAFAIAQVKSSKMSYIFFKNANAAL